MSDRSELLKITQSFLAQPCDENDVARALSQIPGLIQDIINNIFNGGGDNDGDGNDGDPPVDFFPWGWIIVNSNQDFDETDTTISSTIFETHFVNDLTVGYPIDVKNSVGIFYGKGPHAGNGFVGDAMICLRRRDGSFEIIQKSCEAL